MTETTASAAVRDNPELCRYEILLGGDVVGFSAYQHSEDRLFLNHVQVSPEHGGGGLASKLVRQQVDDASQRELWVVPACPFVRKVITDHLDEYRSLVPGEEAGKFGLPSRGG